MASFLAMTDGLLAAHCLNRDFYQERIAELKAAACETTAYIRQDHLFSNMINKIPIVL
jgi:hypothetical protein